MEDFGVIVRVAGPIEVYDASHAEITKRLDGAVADGLVLHVARALDDGFEVIEVWESKEQYETFNREVVGPAMAAIGAPTDAPPPETVEFEPHNLMAVQLR